MLTVASETKLTPVMEDRVHRWEIRWEKGLVNTGYSTSGPAYVEEDGERGHSKRTYSTTGYEQHL